MILIIGSRHGDEVEGPDFCVLGHCFYDANDARSCIDDYARPSKRVFGNHTARHWNGPFILRRFFNQAIFGGKSTRRRKGCATRFINTKSAYHYYFQASSVRLVQTIRQIMTTKSRGKRIRLRSIAQSARTPRRHCHWPFCASGR